MKRGTRITYTYAAGAVVPGKIIRADKSLADWFVVELTDAAGTFRGTAHKSQITVTDNRR